jgi:hypothetical protein
MNKKQKRANKKHKISVERVKRKTREAIATSKTARRAAPARKKKVGETEEVVAA